MAHRSLTQALAASIRADGGPALSDGTVQRLALADMRDLLGDPARIRALTKAQQRKLFTDIDTVLAGLTAAAEAARATSIARGDGLLGDNGRVDPAAPTARDQIDRPTATPRGRARRMNP